jgi:protein-S-isoprenylcysteine O-methyltransferase Ste14
MVNSSTLSESGNESRFERMKMRLVTAIGYLLPFAASLPPLGVWTGLMTVPFVVYLFLMFSNISTAPPLPNLTSPTTLFLLVISCFALLFLFYSVIYLRRAKSQGLVTGGPYRLCRHPQYFSLIIFTLIMTYQSVWILQHTFGMGWLTADQTKIVWLLMLLVYVVIARIEEMHLEKGFGNEWAAYRKRVGFVIPFLPMRSSAIESFIAVLLPYAILEVMLRIPIIL